jgi:tRNA(Ile)-lysidine synthase
MNPNGAVEATVAPPPKVPALATYWAGFSGGLDSTVLLHKLKAANLNVRALHVNHGLQAAASTWVEHCRGLAGQVGAPFYVMDVQVDPNHPGGPEAAAREARYAAIRRLMRPGDCLVTAHHRDDQAETVLMRLLRGSGVAGLAAMRPFTEFPPGFLWRPLLGKSRAELRQYAEAHRLPWVEDPHNLDSRFSRSYLRTDVFPRLNQRWPQAMEQLARTADLCADAVELLDQLAAEDLKRAYEHGGLSVRELLRLPRARRNNLLRAFTAAQRHEAPTFDTLMRLEKEVLRARPDAAPRLAWGDAELRRFRDTVFVTPRLPAAPKDALLEWDGRRDLELPAGCGRLKVLKAPKKEIPLRVGFVQGGERIKPAGSRYTRTLRNLFQESATPPWVRERMPLLFLDEDLEAIADRWATPAFRKAAKGLKFSWEHDLPGDGGT